MRTTHLVVGGLAAVLLAGCGGSTDGDTAPAATSSSPAGNGMADETGPEVAASAAEAVERAGTVHVTGSTVSDGVSQDVDLQLQGDDAAGSITVAGQTIQLISVDDTAYLKASADYWTTSGAPADVVPQIADQWVSIPASSIPGLTSLTLTGVLEDLRSPDSQIQDDVTTDELDGQPVVVVSDSAGGTVSVAAEGDPYPLQETRRSGADSGTLRFSGFGEEQTIEAPPNPIDAGSVGG